MDIRTKIVATLGPASEAPETIERLVHAGCDVFRINFSHGTSEQHARMLEAVRSVEARLDTSLAVLGDLCGPKIRVGEIRDGAVVLAAGEEIEIRGDQSPGDAKKIGVSHPELIEAAKAGQALLLDDGAIRLEVLESRPPHALRCRVVRGGLLKSHKGVNLPETELCLSALTEKDRDDARWIAKRSFDYVALSFVQRPEDVQELRELLAGEGCEAQVLAKIEKPQAVQRIEEILEACDAVMVARGDLGVEMDLPSVPLEQKRIAELAQRHGKPCIVATQMLESMTHAPQPTRAEVSDVANAVLDHTDAVMLSGETAVGEYPVEAVTMMNRVVREAQCYGLGRGAALAVPRSAHPTTGAIASAVRSLLEVVDVSAVAVFTLTGGTARMLSKLRLDVPILAISPHERTCRRMKLYYGVRSFQADTPPHTRVVLDLASSYARQIGLATTGDRIVVVSGRPLGQPGRTNSLVLHTLA